MTQDKKPQVTFEDFSRLDLRVGEVLEAREVEGSEKLVEMTVDFGAGIEKKTIYAGVKKWYEPENLKGRKLAFVANLAPKTFTIGDREYVSEGMLMAAGGEEAVLYTFDKDLPNGTILR